MCSRRMLGGWGGWDLGMGGVAGGREWENLFGEVEPHLLDPWGGQSGGALLLQSWPGDGAQGTQSQGLGTGACVHVLSFISCIWV
jgi:hypothetical protein